MNVIGPHEDPSHCQVIQKKVKEAKASILVVSPFIGSEAADVLFSRGELERRLVSGLTEATPIGVIEDLIRRGVQVRAINHLHAKLYVFDDDAAVVTSANMTGPGLGLPSVAQPNRELGLQVDAEECPELFAVAQEMWDLATVVGEHEIKEWRSARSTHPAAPPKSGGFDVAPGPRYRLWIRCSVEEALNVVNALRQEHQKAEDATDGDILVENLRQDGELSMRAYLWLTGWCHTGGAYMRASRFAEEAARQMFGYVPADTLTVDGETIDLKEWRYTVDDEIPPATRRELFRRHMRKLRELEG